MSHDEAVSVLSSEVYEQAFHQLMSGVELAALPEEQQAAARRAIQLTGPMGPGWPMPTRLDPTRNPTEGV